MWIQFIVAVKQHKSAHFTTYMVQLKIMAICYVNSLVTLTHWGPVTHICVGKLTIIDSDNGLLPGRRQTIIWTNAGRLLIGPLGTNFNEILIGIQTFSFKKMHLKMSSAKWRNGLGLNVLNTTIYEALGKGCLHHITGRGLTYNDIPNTLSSYIPFYLYC